MMRRSILSLALLALLAVFLGGPGVAWLAGVHGGGNALENKALGPRPKLTWQAAADASWGSAFSDWVWDSIPLRDVFLRADHKIDVAVGDSPLPGSVILGINNGPEGFVFTRKRVFGRSAGDVNVKQLRNAIKSVSAAFKEAGVPLVLVVSPNKATMYPEYLPPAYRAENERKVEPVVDALAAYGPPVLNLWAILRKEKQRLLDATDLPNARLRYLFRPYDDHWSVETGRIQAREIVNAVDPTAWDERVLPRIVGYALVESELSKIFLKTGEQEWYAKMEESGLVDVTVAPAPGANMISFVSRPTATFTPKPLKLVVIRDSFLSGFAGMEPGPQSDAGMTTVARFFSRTLFIHWDTLATQPKKAIEQVRDADAVVVQVTQGNVGNVIRYAKVLTDLARATHGPVEGPRTDPSTP